MAWTFTPTAQDLQFCISAKLGTNTVANSGNLNDNDIGKPLKLTASGTYGLCADGDNIDGWLVAVDPETVDGYAFGTVQTGGRVYAQLSGASTFGYMVEAAANEARTVADASGYGQVSSHAGHAVVAADAAIAIATRPLILSKKWRIVAGAVTDDAIVLLECQ